MIVQCFGGASRAVADDISVKVVPYCTAALIHQRRYSARQEHSMADEPEAAKKAQDATTRTAQAAMDATTKVTKSSLGQVEEMTRQATEKAPDAARTAFENVAKKKDATAGMTSA